MSTSLRAYVSLAPAEAPLPVTRVHPATFEALRAAVAPHGWEPMMSVTDEEPPLYRAWVRHTDGRRIFGRHELTAEAAVAALRVKLDRWIR